MSKVLNPGYLNSKAARLDTFADSLKFSINIAAATDNLKGFAIRASTFKHCLFFYACEITCIRIYRSYF